MKDIRKILFLDMPPALCAALEEQFPPHFRATAGGESDLSGAGFDLVIAMGGARAAGSPLLTLGAGGKFRLGALLRQAQQALEAPALYLGDMDIGPYTFRPQDRLLVERAGGREIALTDREAGMLAFLAGRPGRAAGREELLRHVWRYQEGVDTHTLETHIYRLRQKTGAYDILVTEPGGYRLRSDGEEEGEKNDAS